jgi:hypothetical protein
LSIWLAGFCTWLLLDAVVGQLFAGMHDGFLVEGIVVFAGSTLFLWWSMRFLLAGRRPWETLLRPAVVTALF